MAFKPYTGDVAQGTATGGFKPYDGEVVAAPPVARPQIAKKPDGFFESAKAGFKRSLPETKSLLYGAAGAVGGAVGLDGVRDWGVENYQRVQKEEVEPLQGQSGFQSSLKGETSFADWTGDTLGNFGGQALQSLAAAGAGALVGGAAGTAVPGAGNLAGVVGGAVTGAIARPMVKKLVGKKIAELVAKNTAKDAVGKAALRRAGMIAAPTALNIAQETGIGFTGRAEDAAEAGEQLTQGDALRAIGWGVPAGLVDTAAEALTAARVLRGGTGEKLVKRVAAGAARGAVTEGATEGVQAVMERAGANRELTGEEAYSDYIENVAAGALGGSVAGGGGSARRPHIKTENGKARIVEDDATEQGQPIDQTTGEVIEPTLGEVIEPTPVQVVDQTTGQASPMPSAEAGVVSKAVNIGAENGAVETRQEGEPPIIPPDLSQEGQAQPVNAAAPVEEAANAPLPWTNPETGETPAPTDFELKQYIHNALNEAGEDTSATRKATASRLWEAGGVTPERTREAWKQVTKERKRGMTAPEELPAQPDNVQQMAVEPVPEESRGVVGGMQNRDRSRPASIVQMSDIRNNPDPKRLGFSRDSNTGAPMVSQGREVPDSDIGRTDSVVIADTGRVVPVRYAVIEAGDAQASHFVNGHVNPEYDAAEMKALNNGRTAGIQAAWQAGNGEGYKAGLIEDEPLHGVSRAAIESKKRPMIVRLFDPSENLTGAESNASQQLGLSPVEQAQTDASLLPDLSGMKWNNDGSIPVNGNAELFRHWFRNMGATAAATLQDANGMPNAAAIQRLRAAMVSRAYGDERLLAAVAEDVNPDNKNIINALARAATSFSALDRDDPLAMGVRDALVGGLELIREAANQGQPLESLLDQGDLLGRNPHAELVARFMEANKKSAPRMAEAFRAMAEYINRSQMQSATVDVFGGVPESNTQGALNAAGIESNPDTTRALAQNRSGSGEQAGSGLAETGDAFQLEQSPADQAGEQAQQPQELGLFAPPTTQEKVRAAKQKKDAKRNGLGADVVRPEQGAGELLAGKKPVQSDIESSPRQGNTPKASRAKKSEPLSDAQREENFNRWSDGAEHVSSADAETRNFKTGEPVVTEAFHGAKRPDRVGAGFDSRRATSGPMPYFTNSPEMGSNYAMNKQDTSLADEDTDFPSWFKVKVKGFRNEVSIDRAWFQLPHDVRATIAERAGKIELGDAGSVPVFNPDGRGDGIGNYKYELSQARGNVLKALSESWLSSGTIFDDEHLFMDVLRLAGMPMDMVRYDSPRSEFPSVFPVNIRFLNPLVISDIPASVGVALNEAAKRDRSRPQQFGADHWDKRTRTLRDWVKDFNESNGAESYIWTSIPDKVTDVLKTLGYDGIIDVGGKGGGDKHKVYTPFTEGQVKGKFNSGNFDESTPKARKDLLASKTTTKSGATVTTIRDAIRKAYGGLIDALERKGLVEIHQTEKGALQAAAEARAKASGETIAQALERLKKAMVPIGESETNLEGFFDPQTGKSFLIADALTEKAAPATLMHEVGIHASPEIRGVFDAAQDLVQNGKGAFLDGVRARMEQAGETSAEEAAAYIVTAYEQDRLNAPASVKKWVQDFVASIRAWLRRNGLPAGKIGIAEIAAIARQNARSKARRGEPVRNESRKDQQRVMEDSAPYETDLFGNPVPNIAREKQTAKPKGKGVRGDVQPTTSVLGDTPKPAGTYTVRTIVGTEVSRKLGASQVRSFDDLAQATQYLYRSAVERLDGIVTDKNGKPLAVVGGFKGDISSSSVPISTLVAEIVRVPNAAHVWFSHNHPTGLSDLSRADEMLADKIKSVLNGSGIECMGLIAVANGSYSSTDGDTDVSIKAPEKGVSVPVIEREQVRENVSREQITSPKVAIEIAKEAYAREGGAGVILLDTRHNVIGWMPIPEAMLGDLRNTGQLNAIYRSVSEGNVAAVIAVHGGELDAKHPSSPTFTISQNILGAFDAIEVRVLDSINAKTLESEAQKGNTLASALFYSKAGDAEVARIMRDFASTKGAPTEAQVRDAVQQFRDTEKAIGGREAYDKAKKAGKTKLTYGQWVTVRTPRFKRWFGDWEGDPANASKVVDQETGEPMVVYHGTNRDITEFDPSLTKAADVIFTTPIAADASIYAEAQSTFAGHPNVMPLFAVIKHPAYIDGDAYSYDLLSAAVTRSGVDGVIVTRADGQVSIAAPISAAQIKSATANIGTFDAGSDNIMFSRNQTEASAPSSSFIKQAAGIVDSVRKAWGKNQPTLHVATTKAEWQKALREHGEDAGSSENLSSEGFYVTDNNGRAHVYLNLAASTMQNAKRLREVLLHEALGHAGVEAVVDAAHGNGEWSKISSGVNKLRERVRSGDSSVSNAIAKAMRSTERRYGSADDLTFAKEFIAVSAEQGVRNTFVNRVIAAIKQFIRKHFPNTEGWKWSDRDILGLLHEGESFLRESATRGRDGFIGVARNAKALASAQTPTFYSAMLESVSGAKGLPKAGATAGQWKGWLDGAQRRGEFKQAERDWLGVDAWLDAQDKPVTRDALADFIRANQVQVQDVVLGEVETYPADSFMHPDTGDVDTLAGWREVTETDPNAETEAEREESIQDQLDTLIDVSGDPIPSGIDPKFGEWQLPGGQNYRELLLTMPPTAAAEPRGEIIEDGKDPEFPFAIMVDGNETNRSRIGGNVAQDILREEIDRVRERSERKGNFRSIHFDQPNILAHVRYNERTDADGVKTLFLEEIQSDWHQQGRKRGYAGLSTNEQARKAALDAKPMQQWSEADIDWYNARANDAQRDGVPNAPFKATDEWVMLAFKRMVRHAAENGFDRIAWTTGEQQFDRYPYGSDKEKEARLAGMKDFYDNILPKAVNKWAKAFWVKVGRTEINVGKDGKAAVHAIDISPNMRDAALARLPLFSRQDQGSAATWDSLEPSRLDDFVAKIQDKHIDLKRVIEEIKKTGKEVDDAIDPYLREALFHGRTATQTQEFLRDEVEPLFAAMASEGMSIATLEEYLKNRHAEEANDHINRLLDEGDAMWNRGSGISTKDARKYLAAIPKDKKAAFDRLASQVDAIVKATRELMVDYELESRETVDGWADTFKHYIPLQREDDGGGTSMPIGQGFSVKGRETKARTGSTRNVVDVLANIVMQRERIITRGEKNRVGQALYNLAKQNPNENFWDSEPLRERVIQKGKKYYEVTFAGSVIAIVPTRGEARRLIDFQGATSDYSINEVEAKDRVVSRVNPMWKSRDNVVVTKMLNDDGAIVERAVVFNAKNERALRLAHAMKNLDTGELGGVLGASAKVTRFFSAMATQYNPIFGVVNMFRDVQEAMINLTSTPISGRQMSILKNTPLALAGLYSAIRKSRNGEHQDTKWAKEWKEFTELGGQTGYRELFRTSADRAKSLERALKLAGNKSKTRAMFEVSKNWLSDYNEAMENAVRLAAFSEAKNAGLTPERAAELAKNLTVNFNRKGQWTQQASSLYAFFNASAQGTARVAETLFELKDGKPDFKNVRLSATGKKIVAGSLIVGTMQALALAFAGFDDDDPPDFIRERNLIIPTGGSNYITIPMPLGFNVLPNVGRILTENALGGFNNNAKSIIGVGTLVLDMYNPIGLNTTLAQTVAPTPLKPVVDIAVNKDFTGKPIAREDFSSLNPTPGSARKRDTATAWSIALSELINKASGGTDYTPGAFSPTPDQIDYLIGQVGGGVGREASKFAQLAQAPFTDEPLPPYKIPLLGRFYGNTDGDAAQRNRYYRNITALNIHENEIIGRRKAGEDVSGYVSAHPEARLIKFANSVDGQIANLRKKQNALKLAGASREQLRQYSDLIAQKMKVLNDRVKLVNDGV